MSDLKYKQQISKLQEVSSNLVDELEKQNEKLGKQGSRVSRLQDKQMELEKQLEIMGEKISKDIKEIVNHLKNERRR